MGVIKAVTAAVLASVASATSKVIADEAKAWMPTFSKRLLAVAIKKLPLSERERFSEEWESHINEMPGDLSKVITAFGFVIAAGRIRSIVTQHDRGVTRQIIESLLAVLMIFFLLPLIIMISCVIRIGNKGPIFARTLTPECADDGKPTLVFRTRTATESGEEKVTIFNRAIEAAGWNKLPILFDIVVGKKSFSQIKMDVSRGMGNDPSN